MGVNRKRRKGEEWQLILPHQLSHSLLKHNVISAVRSLAYADTIVYTAEG